MHQSTNHRKGLSQSQRSKLITTKDVEGCGCLLKDVEGCGGIVKDVGGCGGMREDVKGCGRM